MHPVMRRSRDLHHPGDHGFLEACLDKVRHVLKDVENNMMHSSWGLCESKRSYPDAS